MRLIFLFLVPTLASYGDVDPNFRRCVSKCYNLSIDSGKDCSNVHPFPSSNIVASWYNSLISRDCVELCEYECMTSITNDRLTSGLPIYKYHGHWPFYRYFGLEEPASVFFSLSNAIPHLWRLLGASRRHQQKQQSYFMTPYLSLYPYISLTAWISSAIFHAKKTPHSTLVDYSTALVFLSYGLLLTLRRIIGAGTRSSSVVQYVGLPLLVSVWSILLASRLFAMQYGHVSYDMHMNACIIIAVATITLWGGWILLGGGREGAYPFNRYRCILCQIGFAAASMLELFDFPPFFRTFDAHSLWHLATVPLGFVWYRFWEEDAGSAEEMGLAGKNK